jgi:predicted ATPase
MIKEIKLHNWKSFEDATLYIDPITVLIGANASGKSNAIEALKVLQKLASGTTFDEAFRQVGRGEVETAFLRDKTNLKLSIKTSVSGEVGDAEVDYDYDIEIENASIFQPIESLKRSNNTQPAPAHALRDMYEYSCLVKSFDIWFNDKTYQIFINFLKNIFILDPIPSNMRGYSRPAPDLLSDASNVAGVLAYRDEESKTALESSLTKYAVHIPEKELRRIWAEKVGRLSSDAMLYAEEGFAQDKAELVDARSMSDGTLRFLAVLTALLTRPENSLLVVEDIDSGLHPSRLHYLLNAIREIGQKRHIDVLMTTHNSAILDVLPPGITPFVTVAHRDPATGVSKLTLLEDLDDLPKLFARGGIGRMVSSGDLEESLKREEESSSE